jgi:hypothetical protein
MLTLDRCEPEMSGEANVTSRRETMARKAIGLAVETFIEAEKTLPITVSAELVVTVGTSEVRLTPLQGLGFAEQLARASFRRAITEEILAAAPSNGSSGLHFFLEDSYIYTLNKYIF